MVILDLRPDLGSAPIEFENRQYATPVDFAKSLGYAYGRVRTRSFGRPTRADAEEFAKSVDEHGIAAAASLPALATWRREVIGHVWQGWLEGRIAVIGDPAAPLGMRLLPRD